MHRWKRLYRKRMQVLSVEDVEDDTDLKKMSDETMRMPLP